MLVVFAGLPGSGKTTLARGLSESLGASYIRIDSIEQAIRIANDTASSVGDVGYRIGYALARDNLRAGRAVVADSVNPVRESREGWRAVAQDAGVDLIEIEVICSDRTEHRRRVENRDTDIAGFVLPTWDAVVAREYHEWDRGHLCIDTAGRTIEQSLEELIALFDARMGGV